MAEEEKKIGKAKKSSHRFIKIKFPKVKTPTTLQMEALECGAASLSMVLGYYKKFIPLEMLRVDCGVSRDGTKASNILKAARKYGLECRGMRYDLTDLSEVQFPAIIFWNFNHFVVLEGFKKDKAYINDPALGKRVISFEEFDYSYTGVALEFKKGENFTPGGRKDSILPKIHSRIKDYKLILSFLLLICLLMIIPGFVAPSFSRFFIDHILVGGSKKMLKPLLFAMGVTTFFNFLLNYLQKRYLLYFQTKLSLSSSAKFIDHLFRMPADFFVQRMPGELFNRLASNANIAGLISEKFLSLVINIIKAVFFAVLMFFYDWVLAVISIFSIGLNILSLKLSSEGIKNGTFKIQLEKGKLDGLTMSGIAMIESLKASGSENDFFQQWSGQQAKVVQENQKISKTTQLLGLIPTTLNAIVDLLILAVGALRVMDGHITIGMLIAFQMIQSNFSEPIASLSDLIKDILSSSADMRRVDDVMEYPAVKKFRDDFENSKEASLKPIAKLNGTISLRDITFGYSRLAPPLISGFNLELTPGKRIALVGGSGSGKSTIGKLVSSLYEPWEGEILYDGKPLNEIERNQFAASVSIVDQNISLFSGTIRDNITMWNSTIPEATYIQAAKDALIHDVIISRPEGYFSEIHEGGTNFSGGQRQRLEIARALANEPRILIMDEATSALDPITEKVVDENIRRRGCTSIVIAHRLSTIRDADEIIVLDHGVPVQRGTHEELVEQDGLYKELIKTM